jgi:hypothetical protein
MRSFITRVVFLFFLLPGISEAQSTKLITNHVGYEYSKSKHAIMMAETKVTVGNFELVDAATGRKVYTGKPVYSGPVSKWKNWLFWTIDFSDYKTPGSYFLRTSVAGKPVQSYPFSIGKNVLEQATISDVIYYFITCCCPAKQLIPLMRMVDGMTLPVIMASTSPIFRFPVISIRNRSHSLYGVC